MLENPSLFESRSLERSLAELESVAGASSGGGSFAAVDFALPPDESAVTAETLPPGVTLPWWVIYAIGVGLAVVAAGSFLVGVWWAASAAN